jgi:hypothetical protein
MKLKLSLLSMLVFACVMVTGASAGTITFNFSTTPGNTTSANYVGSDGVTTISAMSGTSVDLLFKNGGGDETGLGLAVGGNNEIIGSQSIIFDLTSLFSLNVTDLTLALGSIQTGESGKVCDSNNMCVTFGPSDSGQAVSIMALYSDMLASHSPLLTITAPAGDVLVDGLTATTSVPEPSSLLLLGSGILLMAGAVFAMRKRLPGTAVA